MTFRAATIFTADIGCDSLDARVHLVTQGLLRAGSSELVYSSLLATRDIGTDIAALCSSLYIKHKLFLGALVLSINDTRLLLRRRAGELNLQNACR